MLVSPGQNCAKPCLQHLAAQMTEQEASSLTALVNFSPYGSDAINLRGQWRCTKEVYIPKNQTYLLISNHWACSASSSLGAGTSQSKAYGIKHKSGPKKEELEAILIHWNPRLIVLLRFSYKGYWHLHFRVCLAWKVSLYEGVKEDEIVHLDADPFWCNKSNIASTIRYRAQAMSRKWNIIQTRSSHIWESHAAQIPITSLVLKKGHPLPQSQEVKLGNLCLYD